MKLIDILAILTIICAVNVIAYEDDERSDVNVKEEFPQIHWDELRAAMEKEGVAGVVAFIDGFDDDEDRRKLYSYSMQAFYGKEWDGKRLDGYIEVAKAGIAEGLKQAEVAADAETAGKRTDYANMLSYNLSADLADCWPGDELTREKRHFEAGLKAAEECVSWREELSKGPFPFSIAYWAKGIHQLSLGDNKGSLESFNKAFAYAVEYAKAEGVNTDVSQDGDFGVILEAGYIGIAEMAGGIEGGKERYDEAIAAYRAQVDNVPDKKDDAQFGIDQLEKVKDKYAK